MSDRDQRSAPKGARDSEPREDATPAVGQALQDQVEQALQPAMAELRERITASVRRELEEKLHDAGRTSHPPTAQSRERLTERRQDSPRQSTSRRDANEDEEHDSFDASDSDETTDSRAVASPELGQALQEQLAELLQPAMAEFREQMAATVRREVDETLHQDRRRAPADAERSTNRGRADEDEPSDQGADRPADDARSTGAGPSDERGSQALRSLLGKPLLEALPQVLEQQGEQWLRSRLDLGIDLLFSGWVRSAVQREVERTLERVTRVTIERIPDRATRDDLRAQSEKTVERLVRTGLDKLFADDVRDDLKARGHQAVGALFHPDVRSVLQHVQELLLSLLEGLLAVLRECWDQILQFLTRVVVALLQPRLTEKLKDAFASRTTTKGQQGEAKAAEARESLTEPDEDVAHEDVREVGKSRQRTREDERSADSHGDEDSPRRGRATSGRSPASRRTPGRSSSSERSASSRPSRAASR